MTLLMRDNEKREEGIQKGRQEGRMEMLIALVNDRIITLKDASAMAKLSEEEFVKKQKEYNL